MTLFAPTAPPQILAQLKKHKVMGGYHLLLAHDVCERATAYKQVFRNMKDLYIIMDNSTNELGAPASLDILRKATTIVPTTYLVLPDYISDHDKTIQASHEAANIWHDEGLGPFMAVPQGTTLNEYIDCTKQLMHLPGVQSLGIPKKAVDNIGSRNGLITWIRKVAPNMILHMLGFSNDLLDDIACCRRPEIVGIDSAVPIREGMNGIQMELGTHVGHSERGDFWDTKEEVNDLALKNLAFVREWIA